MNEFESEIRIAFDSLVPDGADEYSVSVLKDLQRENPSCGGKTVLSRIYRVDVGDGVSLCTRVFSPDFDSEYPVIFIRSPYSALASGIQMNGASAVMAMHEYCVVVQDCRGTGDSGGDWNPFVSERADGLASIEWIKTQEWSQDSIGMFGPSYLTINQWLIADVVPKEVKTLFLTVAGTERYRQMYMGGMFRHEIYTMWAVENSGVKTDENPGELYQKALAVKPHIDMDEEVFQQKLPWYRDWITHPSADSELWTTGVWKTLQDVPSRVSIPVHMIAGWFDHHLDGMCVAYKNLPRSIKERSRFVIGPWDHSFKTPGDKKFGGDIDLSTLCVKEALEWFDYQLKRKTFSRDVGCVETYVVNGDSWKKNKEWPEAVGKKVFFLDAETDEKTCCPRLNTECPEKSSSRSFEYDSSNPVKTVGGSSLLAWIHPEYKGARHGCVLQPEPNDRNDVVSFLSEPLAADLEIVGNILVTLNVKSEAVDTCFFVKIIEESDGRYFNVCDGISSMEFRAGNGLRRPYEPGAVALMKIEMWPVAWKFRAGSKIRVDVTSSNFPMYNIHRNAAEIWSLQGIDRAITNTVITGGESASRIELPLVE